MLLRRFVTGTEPKPCPSERLDDLAANGKLERFWAFATTGAHEQNLFRQN